MTLVGKWSLTSQLPSPNVVLIFNGMMALSERTEPPQFEFLCHGESGGTRSHDLAVEIDGKPLENASKFREFEFYIIEKENEKPANSNPIGAYSPKVLDDKAFSYLVDLEQVYGKVLKKRKPPKFANRLTIKNGVLFTSELSEYEFSLIDETGKEIMPKRNIATELSLNISLADNEIALLRWFNDKVEPNFLRFDNHDAHTIRFNNDCVDTSTPDLKCRESDFPLNFDNVVDDDSARKSDLKQFFNLMTSKSAPCSSSGYGGTDGWDG